MFARQSNGEAFHELSLQELGLVEHAIRAYEANGKFRIAAGERGYLVGDYEVIRHNLLAGESTVTGRAFRTSSGRIIRHLLDSVKAEVGVYDGSVRTTVMLLPWRAGLAFASPAWELGIRNFYHVGARRNEATLRTDIYFEEIPTILWGSLAGDCRKCKAIIADPMLATGNTVIAGIELLKLAGVAEVNIIVLAVISAPEGVDQVLQLFPRVKIVVGSHDECLNSRGYIVPGLGDFGDLYFDGLDDATLNGWYSRGILSREGLAVLKSRMEVPATA